MLLPFRDREKPAAVPAPSVLPQPKKQGRWCAVHVRVAWEIYHHQQKQQQEAATGPGPATKPADKPGDPLRGDPLRGDPLRGDPLKGDPLRHSNHLLPGAALPRPPDLQAAGPAALLASSHSRALEALPHHSTSFFSPGPLGLPPFPRPAPCPPSMIGLGFGGLGKGGLLGRDLPNPALTSPHEWNRLHRTPPSFPVWPKPDLEREKEKEREAEREREREREQERERDLRREEEREREQRLASQRLEERTRYKDSDLSQPSARPRSRSPLRNGRLDSSKSDLTGGVDRRLDEKVVSAVKVKEERREEELLQAERDKMMQNSYLGLAGHHLPPHSVGPPLGFTLLDRTRMVPPPHTYLPGLDPRPAMSSPAMWNPFDKTSQEINHRLELERERERERMAIMSRLSGATSITLMEQERLKEQMFREHQERELELRRQYLERLQPYERERLSYEQKMRSMEAVFASAAYSPFARTISPMFNHHAAHHLPTGSKSNSPASLAPGIPPPLIPSASATVVHPPAPTGVPPRSHDSSPTSSKSKGYSPADSTSDLKDKRDSCSTDPDAHSR
ncbi:RNA-binding protein 25-like isoform X1 [Pomacea canaliculata]|uniref:RNA-binding protein 25-like isoform X1 n=1 Tax=Pomacea canaliculata TaxID=400727 RepID=UPI000D72C5F3|nr:RNA-binding protein 25-like isoform X1 [Pomacea canaliculata]XP_025093043.1 RNA-binding protein 25-like isoform X1 [Pomacea canaliculata]